MTRTDNHPAGVVYISGDVKSFADTHGRRSGEIWQTVLTMLDDSCLRGCYGRYAIEWVVQDGVIQTINTRHEQLIRDPQCKTKKPPQK